jgi:uncharacterized protein YfiM (DUF2279 family)
MKKPLLLEYRLSFKYFILIGILSIVLQSGNILYSNETPEALKSYFKSFGKEEKKDIDDQWFSADKGYHVLGSMISTTLIGQISSRGFDNSIEKSKAIGAGTTFTLGLAKEIHDSQKPKNYFSWKDLTANGVGIIVGIILLGIN